MRIFQEGRRVGMNTKTYIVTYPPITGHDTKILFAKCNMINLVSIVVWIECRYCCLTVQQKELIFYVYLHM